MLITMACIVVLFAISMNAMNKAVTGQGSTVKGTVRSTQDQINFYALYQSLMVNAMDNDGRFITPGEMGGGNDPSKNTTANLFSAMVADNYMTTGQLISGNEFNPGVYADDDYNHYAYDPAAGVFWDESFVADLDQDSNVSFAHMPLHGERFRRFWQSHSPSGVALIGNRGPRDWPPRACCRVAVVSISLPSGRAGGLTSSFALHDALKQLTPQFLQLGVFVQGFFNQ